MRRLQANFDHDKGKTIGSLRNLASGDGLLSIHFALLFSFFEVTANILPRKVKIPITYSKK